MKKPSGKLTMGRRVRPNGFVLIDVLFGIIILAGVTVTMAIMLRRENAAEKSLADSRSALHLAEHALLNLQHGQPMPSPVGNMHLTIQPAVGGHAPDGFIWARVEAAVDGHRRSLVGPVPVSSIPSPGTQP